MASNVWTPVYIGLGSNLDDPRNQVRRAAVALARLPHCRWMACSPLYRSAPLGLADQPDYINAVVALLSVGEPSELMRALLGIEDAMGRRREARRWGPRRIDLDLLLHGDTVLTNDELTLPHPGLVERAFVVCPLADLAPFARLPDGQQIARLAADLDCSQLTRIGEPVTP